jgi:hypothetical protein
MAKMSRTQINTLIRFIKMRDYGQVLGVDTIVKKTLARLGVDPSATGNPVNRIPRAADDYNMSGFLRYADSIQPGDEGAIAQLLNVKATVDKRLKGN